MLERTEELVLPAAAERPPVKVGTSSFSRRPTALAEASTGAEAVLPQARQDSRLQVSLGQRGGQVDVRLGNGINERPQ